MVTRIRPENRRVFVNVSGDPLTRGAVDQAFRDFLESVIKRGGLKEEDWFTLNGLKHRGITDTRGNKADKQLASGHKSAKTLEKYDHEVPLVEPAAAPEFSGGAKA